MNYEICFKHIFESIPDYKKIVLLLFIFQNDKKLFHEIGFSEHDINRLNLEFKKILVGHHGEYLDFVKNEEESIIERSLNK